MSKQKPNAETTPANGSTRSKRNVLDRQPAYFMSLNLENVRCFGPKQTLDLSDGDRKPARWTIILGVNGTGKTTILQSLVGFERIERITRKDEADVSHRAPRFFSSSLYEPITFTRGDRGEVAFQAVIADCPKLGKLPVSLHKQSSTLSKGRRSYSGPNPTPWCCAYGAGRRVGSASLSNSGSDDPTATLFSDHADLRNPEEWLLRLDYAAAKEADAEDQQQRRLDQAKELLLSILPEVEDIRLTSPKGPNPTPRAEFKTPYGWVPLRQLGYGYQTLITWVTDLANRMAERYPDSKNPLAEPAVVLVDEIDLHLHPVWQRKLIGFLTERFPNTQFIATAHSPLMAQAAADANLAVLRREGDHVVIDNEVDDIRNWRIDQILTSDLFGLETARPPQVEALIVERNQLLDKPKLTAGDRKRLKELEAEIGDLPYGETPQERKEREEVRKALDLLVKERKPAR